jgi:hypothetical protein
MASVGVVCVVAGVAGLVGYAVWSHDRDHARYEQSLGYQSTVTLANPAQKPAPVYSSGETTVTYTLPLSVEVKRIRPGIGIYVDLTHTANHGFYQNPNALTGSVRITSMSSSGNCKLDPANSGATNVDDTVSVICRPTIHQTWTRFSLTETIVVKNPGPLGYETVAATPSDYNNCTPYCNDSYQPSSQVYELDEPG